MIWRRHAAFGAMILMASAASGSERSVSWGRAGVSLGAYRSDAIECARTGADTDIREEPATADFLAAERLVDRTLNQPSMQTDYTGDSNDSVGMVRRRLQPDRKLAQLQRTLVAATETCLRRRGYVPFQLTGAQEKRLRRLDRGSEARRLYLHGLASDPAVLATQTVGDAPRRD